MLPTWRQSFNHRHTVELFCCNNFCVSWFLVYINSLLLLPRCLFRARQYDVTWYVTWYTWRYCVYVCLCGCVCVHNCFKGVTSYCFYELLLILGPLLLLTLRTSSRLKFVSAELFLYRLTNWTEHVQYRPARSTIMTLLTCETRIWQQTGVLPNIAAVQKF